MAVTMTSRSSRTRSYFVGLFLLLVTSLGPAVPPGTYALVEAPSSLQSPTSALPEVVMEAMQLGLKTSEKPSGIAWHVELLTAFQRVLCTSYILKRCVSGSRMANLFSWVPARILCGSPDA